MNRRYLAAWVSLAAASACLTDPNEPCSANQELYKEVTCVCVEGAVPTSDLGG